MARLRKAQFEHYECSLTALHPHMTHLHNILRRLLGEALLFSALVLVDVFFRPLD